jgi:hypothetical protein
MFSINRSPARATTNHASPPPDEVIDGSVNILGDRSLQRQGV